MAVDLVRRCQGGSENSRPQKLLARKVEFQTRRTLSVTALVIKESLGSFLDNKDLDSAATLACYGFLSLMPLLMLVIFLLSFFIQSSDEVLTGMGSVMSEMFPGFAQPILKELLLLSKQKGWGLVSLLVLLWSITPFVSAMRNAIERIARHRRQVNFFVAKLLDLAAVLAVLVLFVFFAASKILDPLRLLGFVRWQVALNLMGTGATFLLTMSVLAFFYFAFSPVRLRLPHLMLGALVTTLLLAAMRPVFGLFLQFNSEYGYVFGSLKTLFLLIIWVYYTFAVVLFGAEVISNSRRRHALVLRDLFLKGKDSKLLVSSLLAGFVREYDEPETLFHAGDSGTEMFYVASGKVELNRDGRTLAVMEPGQYFGEMSLLLGSPRTATAEVIPGTQLVAISRTNFDTIMRENPEIVTGILKEMALRLQRTNEQLNQQAG